MDTQNKKIDYFLVGTNPTFYFGAYVDSDGYEKSITVGKLPNGMDRIKKFKFKNGKLSVSANQEEEIAHIDNSPFTKGSPNLRGRHQIVKIDKQADAATTNANNQVRVTAEFKALQLPGEILDMVASLTGVTSKDIAIQRQSVGAYAARKPEEFMELVDDKNLYILELKSFVKKALTQNVIRKQGNLYMWEQNKLGLSENEVVEYFAKQEDMFIFVKEQYEQVSGTKFTLVTKPTPTKQVEQITTEEVTSEPKAEKRGRPPGAKNK